MCARSRGCPEQFWVRNRFVEVVQTFEGLLRFPKIVNTILSTYLSQRDSVATKLLPNSLPNQARSQDRLRDSLRDKADDRLTANHHREIKLR